MPTKFVSRLAFLATAIYPGSLALTHRGRLWDALKASIGLTDVDRVTITASASLTIEQCGTLQVDATAGNVVLTAPASGVDADEALYEIDRLDSSSNTVTFAAAGTDTVGGAASVNVLGTMRLRLPAGKTDWRVHSISGGTPVAARNAIGAIPPTRQILTASGTYTNPGARLLHVTGVAGGAAGGGTAGANQAGAGGGAGAPIDEWIDATAITTVAYVIGAAGLGSTGSNGGTTSFGAYVSATGGTVGDVGSATPGASNGGLGGINTSSDIPRRGAAGGNNVNSVCGGKGADSAFGSGGNSVNNGGVGQSATGYGAGGAGGGNNASAVNGGDGSPGILVVEEHY